MLWESLSLCLTVDLNLQQVKPFCELVKHRYQTLCFAKGRNKRTKVRKTTNYRQKSSGSAFAKMILLQLYLVHKKFQVFLDN